MSAVEVVLVFVFPAGSTPAGLRHVAVVFPNQSVESPGLIAEDQPHIEPAKATCRLNPTTHDKCNALDMTVIRCESMALLSTLRTSKAREIKSIIGHKTSQEITNVMTFIITFSHL